MRLAAHRETQHGDIDAVIRQYGGVIVGTQDFERCKPMGAFHRDVPDILATMFDTVQPRWVRVSVARDICPV